jgi:hypothetical protein
MPYVEFACEGRLLFRTEASDSTPELPRIQEIVVIDDTPYVVIDVEYWARRLGATDRRQLWPTVYVAPIAPEDWALRLERRRARAGEAPRVRY